MGERKRGRVDFNVPRTTQGHLGTREGGKREREMGVGGGERVSERHRERQTDRDRDRELKLELENFILQGL